MEESIRVKKLRLNRLSSNAHVQRFLTKQNTWIPWTYRQIRILLNKQLLTVLKILKETRNVTTTLIRVEPKLFQPATEKLLREIHTKIGMDFGKSTLDILEKQIDQNWLQKYFDGLVTQLQVRGRQIADTSVEILETILRKSGEEGLSINQTATLLRSEFRRLSPSRAATIARTEIVSASNRGSLTTVSLESEALGLDTIKIWRATGDSRTRDSHRRANGQKRPLDEPFIVQNQE
ncbi:MAG: phage minor head protein, partial [Candidatus Heimdallarchaeota archaeon]